MTNSVNQLFKQIVATHKKTSKPKKTEKHPQTRQKAPEEARANQQCMSYYSFTISDCTLPLQSNLMNKITINSYSTTNYVPIRSSSIVI